MLWQAMSRLLVVSSVPRSLMSCASVPLLEPSLSLLCCTLAHVRCLKVRELKKLNVCTCVCTAASLPAHGMTTLPILICEFVTTLRAWTAPSHEGASATSLGLPKARVVKCSWVFSRCGLRSSPSDSIGFPNTSLNSLHRSRTFHRGFES